MNFKGLAIQTDVLCASGTTTAYFPPDALVACSAILSPTEPETLSFAIARTDARLSEVVVGRVVRTRFTDDTDDVEWDIVAIDDSSRSNVVQVTALPILMRLARCIVKTTNLSDGSVTFDYTGVDLQASEWLDELIFPATTAAGLTWITAGTIDSTRRFGIAGEWSSALEVLAAISAPGSASCEYRLRRNGNTGYYLDLVTQIGSSAATVRVRPQVNLLETARQRNAVDIATRLYPRGSTSSVSTRTMANHIWQVDSVVSGTVLQLRDVNSGVGPIAYDDQLNGLWLAPMNSTTFSSQEVTASVVSTQRVTISNTTGIVAGDWVRFFYAAGSNAQRVTSVTHPTLVKPPTQGGIGDRGQILDRPNIVADTNLAKNPTMVDWTVSADPPNTWSEYAATPGNVSFDKESTDVIITGTNTWRIRTTGTSSGARGEPLVIPPDGVFSGALVLTQQPGVRVETGDISVWKLATARHTATVWLKVADSPPPIGFDNARVYMYLRDVSRPDFATKPIHPSLQAGLIGTWDYDEGSERGTWLRFQSAAFDLSTFVDFGVSTLNQYHNDIEKVNGKVRVCIELAGGNTGSSEITDKFLYPNYLGAWSSVKTYSINDVVLRVVSGVTRYFIALTVSNNKQPENHLGTNWAEVDGGNTTREYRGQNVASGWDIYVGPVTMAESTEPIGDREYSGGTELWQSANASLPSRSAVARGYDLRVADLARDDGTTYADFEFVPGGTVEVINPELENDVASLRLVEYRPNYLQPLQSEVRVGLPPERLTDLTGQYTDPGTTAAPTTTGAGTVVSGGGTFSLPDTGVVPGTYGSSTQTPQIVVDSKGRLTSAANVTIVAGTAAALTPGATINGQLFTGASNITITAGTPQALTAGTYLTSGGTFDGTNPRTFAVDATDANTASKVVARDASGNFAAGTIVAALQGNASTATALQTARNINGVSFNGTADITVTAAAGTLTGNTLASGVTASSLTSVGTIGTGVWQGTSVGKDYGGTGLTSSAFTGITNERVVIYDGGSGNYEILNAGNNGDALVYSGGALAWGTATVGSHVLADTTGLGSQHTTSGLTAGMILQATGASTARFQTPSIPASSVTAGTFSGVSYTVTNDLTVSGTLTGSLTGNASTATTLQTARNINGVSFNGSADITVAAAAGTLTGSTLAANVTASSLTSVGTLTNLTVTNPITGSITGNAATVTDGVYTTGSYADPSFITSLAGSKITGNISGSAANVTGTVAIGNGGTGTTNYFVSGSGTRAIVYDIVSNAFEAVASGTSGQFLQSAGSTGDITWGTPPNFTSSVAGYAPASGGGTSNFLRADGTWAVPSVGSVSANNVTAGTFAGATYTFSNSVTFTSGVRVAFGETYKILNGGGTAIDVLSATTLGTGVINSSLTSVGTLTSGALGAGFTAIDNARLANSSITINGSSVSLGGSITVNTSKWTSSGANIYFDTGNVAIGTTPSASYRLLLRGTGATSATYAFGVENSAATNTFYVRDDGNVAIPNGNLGVRGSPSSTAALAVGGGTSYSTFAKPSSAGYQTVALFGSADNGIFFTTDSSLITRGAYYNAGWIATSTSGTLINMQSASPEIQTFSGATVGSAPSWSAGATILHAGNYNSYAPTLTGTGASGTWSINVSGSAGSVGWANITSGTRTGHGDLRFQPPDASFAGLQFLAVNGDGAGWFLIRGGSDTDVYTSNGITLVADRGWLTLAQRETASRGVRIMSGVTSTERLLVTSAGDIQFVNGNSFTYGGNAILHAGNYSSYALPLSGGTVTGNLTVTGQWINSGNSASNTGLAIYNENSNGGYGAIRNFQGGANNQTIHFFSNNWQGGNFANVSAGAINITGYNGVTFGPWNLVSGRIDESGNFWVRSSMSVNGNTVLHAGNYTSYAPTLTGGGASGTWGINVTGNSATVGGLTPNTMFNNMGQAHSSYSTFDSVPNFGVYYVQANGGAPSNGTQYYGFTLGLGSEYPLSQYGMQIAFPRIVLWNTTTPYVHMRIKEGGSWQSWTKIWAGYADSAGSVANGLTTSNYSSYALPLGGGTVSGIITTVGLEPVGIGTNSGVPGAPYKFGYQESGAWTFPFPDLIIGYHTGMKFGGNTSYGGMRFYADHPQYNPAELFSIGNGDSHVRVANNLYVGGNLALHAGNYSSYALPIGGGTLSGSRQIGFDTGSGNITIKGETGGWATGLYFLGSSGTNRGGFGSLGGNDALSYFWIGPAYNNNWLELSGGATNSKVALQQNGNQVLHAGNYSSYALPLSGGSVSGAINLTNRVNGILVNASSSASDGGSIAIQQVTAEGWTGIFADYEPFTGWGLWHDNPNNFFCFTSESSSGGIRSFTVPSRLSGNRTAYEKVRIEQSSGDLRVGGSVYITTSGHLALHAGNYGSYALPLGGGTVSGTTYFTGSSYPVFVYGNGNTASVAAVGLQVFSTSGTGAVMAFHRGGYFAVNMGLDSDNVIRIGGWSAAANRLQMDMSGNLTMAGNVTAYSDIRFKANVKRISGALAKVRKLRGVTFTRTDQEDKERVHAGVIAQEMELVHPEVVYEDSSGIKHVAYGNTIGLLIEAINDLAQMVEELS